MAVLGTMTHSRAEHPIPPPIKQWLSERFGEWCLIEHASWARENSNVWQIQLPTERGFLKLSPSVAAFERETVACREWLPRAVATPTRLPRLIADEPSLRVLLTSPVEGHVVRTLSGPLSEEEEQRIHRSAGVAADTLHGLQASPTEQERSAARALRVEQLLQLSDRRRYTSADVLTDAEVALVDRAESILSDYAEACAIGFRHGDFQPRNWLTCPAPDARADGLGVIDFEESGIGFALEDFGWLFAVVWNRQPVLRASFLAGYGRELSASEEVFLSAFTLLGSLQHIAEGREHGLPQKLDNGRAALAIAGQAMTQVAPKISGV